MRNLESTCQIAAGTCITAVEPRSTEACRIVRGGIEPPTQPEPRAVYRSALRHAELRPSARRPSNASACRNSSGTNSRTNAASGSTRHAGHQGLGGQGGRRRPGDQRHGRSDGRSGPAGCPLWRKIALQHTSTRWLSKCWSSSGVSSSPIGHVVDMRLMIFPVASGCVVATPLPTCTVWLARRRSLEERCGPRATVALSCRIRGAVQRRVP